MPTTFGPVGGASAAVQATYSGEAKVPTQAYKWRVPTWAKSMLVDGTKAQVVSFDPQSGWMPVAGSAMLLPLGDSASGVQRLTGQRQRPTSVYCDASDKNAVAFLSVEVSTVQIYQNQEVVQVLISQARSGQQPDNSGVTPAYESNGLATVASAPAITVGGLGGAVQGYFESTNPLLAGWIDQPGIDEPGSEGEEEPRNAGVEEGGLPFACVVHRGVVGARFSYQITPHANGLAFPGGVSPAVAVVLEVGADSGNGAGSPPFLSQGYVVDAGATGADGVTGAARTLGFDLALPAAAGGLTWFGAGGGCFLPNMFRVSAYCVDTQVGGPAAHTFDLKFTLDIYRVP